MSTKYHNFNRFHNDQDDDRMMVRMMIRMMIRMICRMIIRMIVRMMIRMMIRIMVRMTIRMMVRMMIRMMIRMMVRMMIRILSDHQSDVIWSEISTREMSSFWGFPNRNTTSLEGSNQTILTSIDVVLRLGNPQNDDSSRVQISDHQSDVSWSEISTREMSSFLRLSTRNTTSLELRFQTTKVM